MTSEAPLSKDWLVLHSGCCEPALNMGLDTALMESSSERGRPVLRFYGWTEPAATFGYFQGIAEIEQATPLRPLVRRPTGGGLVPHDRDWTYSAAIPPACAWYDLLAAESYRLIHRWIMLAFARLDVTAELAPCCRKEIPGRCFEGHEESDLLWHGRKIAGAAQRRNKNGLLIQGSVQPGLIRPAPDRAGWEKAMMDVAAQIWGVYWEDLQPCQGLSRRAHELARTRYSQPAWNRRR